MIIVNKRRKTVYLVSLITVSIFAISLKLVFRSYLYRECGSCSVIAGSIPNFVAVIFFSLVYKISKDGKPDASPIKMSLMGTGIMIFYEFIQLLIQGRTFDWLDILASILGGLSVFIFLFIIDRYIM